MARKDTSYLQASEYSSPVTESSDTSAVATLLLGDVCWAGGRQEFFQVM